MSKVKRLSLMQPRSSAESQMEHARDKLRGAAVLAATDFAGLEQQTANQAHARVAFKAWFKAWIARNAASVELQRKHAAQYRRNGGV